MKKRKWRSILRRILASLLLLWGLFTLWAQFAGPVFLTEVGPKDAIHQALVVFDPDPFYNLDEQVCLAYASGFSVEGWRVTVASVQAARNLPDGFDHYAFCANTYNWGPDLAICNFIENKADLFQKPVVTITLGSGSTARAERLLLQKINKSEALLLHSAKYWLMRPNDEARMEESNVEVAKDMARELGKKIAKEILRSPGEYSGGEL